jgi:hypothetical protein
VVVENAADVEEADLPLPDRALGEQVAYGLQQAVGQLGGVLGLPVVVRTLGFRLIEEGLLLGVRPCLQQVDRGVAQGSDRCKHLVGVCEIPCVADDHGAGFAAVKVLGHERRRRSMEQDQPDG